MEDRREKAVQAYFNSIETIQRINLGELRRLNTFIDDRDIDFFAEALSDSMRVYLELQFSDLGRLPIYSLNTLSALPGTIERGLNAAFKNLESDQPNEIERFTRFALGMFLPNRKTDTYSLEEYMRDFVHQVIKEVQGTVIPNLGYTQRVDRNLKSISGELAKVLAQSTSSLSEMREQHTELQSKLEEAEAIVRDIVGASGKAGIALYTQLFEKEAKSNIVSSRLWFAGIVLSTLVAISTALFAFNLPFGLLPIPVKSDLRALDVIQIAAPRAFILATLYYVLIFCVKNYNSARHNYVVNKHRQNAIASFQAFVGASEDRQVRDAVLMQATNSIFSASVSGYIPSEPEPDSSNKIIEIVKNITSSK